MRQMDESESKHYKFGSGIVTVDDAVERGAYNCHGFCLGVRDVIVIPNHDDDVPVFMANWGYVKKEHRELRDSDEVVALFDKGRYAPERWHTAKRLHSGQPTELYESKFGVDRSMDCPDPLEDLEDEDPELLTTIQRCGSDAKAGLRIVHELDDIRPLYGVVHSYWVRQSSLQSDNYKHASLLVEDSSADIEEIISLRRGQR